jgi:hypothetical protein
VAHEEHAQSCASGGVEHELYPRNDLRAVLDLPNDAHLYVVNS